MSDTTIDIEDEETPADENKKTSKKELIFKLKTLALQAISSTREIIGDAKKTIKGQIILGVAAAFLTYAIIACLLWLTGGSSIADHQARVPFAEVVIETAKTPNTSTSHSKISRRTTRPHTAQRVAGRIPLPSPLNDLLEDSEFGPLPKIDTLGLEPRIAYAMPFDISDPRPRVALIITGLGLSRTPTEMALKLPAEIGLAYSPYTQNLDMWLAETRAHGHESYIQLPLEPTSYPLEDPGPRTLTTSSSDLQNSNHLNWIMGRGAGYVGLVAQMGDYFSRDLKRMQFIMATLKHRGLLYIDNAAAQKSSVLDAATETAAAWVKSDININSVLTGGGIDSQFAQLVEIAKNRGQALGLIQIYPLSLNKLEKWIQTLENNGIVLAPPTALVE